MIVDLSLSFVQNCRHYWEINTVIRFSERKRDPNRGKNRHAEIVRDVPPLPPRFVAGKYDDPARHKKDAG